MTQLIGDKGKRTINPEAWREHNRLYTKEKPREEQAEGKMPESIVNPATVESEDTLEKILSYDSECKPLIALTILEDTVVATPTQESHDKLMQIYESGGWKWYKHKIHSTQNNWKVYKNNTCITAGKSEMSSVLGTFELAHEEYYKRKHWKIISIQEFCEIQNLTTNIITEINLWYDTNRPDRPSKG